MHDRIGIDFLNALQDVTRNDLVFLKRDRQLPGQAHKSFASGKRVKAFSGIERAARLKLDRLDAAVELRDLGALPGNRLEAFGLYRSNEPLSSVSGRQAESVRTAQTAL